jgi:hypothetical protein
MSREAHAAIDKAEAGGMRFADTAPAKTPKPDKPAMVRAPRIDMPVGESYDPDRRRFERTQMFKGTDSNGKVWKVNAIQACRNCRYSLTGHECNKPTVLVGGGEWIEVTPL